MTNVFSISHSQQLGEPEADMWLGKLYQVNLKETLGLSWKTEEVEQHCVYCLCRFVVFFLQAPQTRLVS